MGTPIFSEVEQCDNLIHCKKSSCSMMFSDTNLHPQKKGVRVIRLEALRGYGPRDDKQGAMAVRPRDRYQAIRRPSDPLPASLAQVQGPNPPLEPKILRKRNLHDQHPIDIFRYVPFFFLKTLIHVANGSY
jgi:hypothetical protein